MLEYKPKVAYYKDKLTKMAKKVEKTEVLKRKNSDFKKEPAKLQKLASSAD